MARFADECRNSEGEEVIVKTTSGVANGTVIAVSEDGKVLTVRLGDGTIIPGVWYSNIEFVRDEQ